jgi:hypothetical protein
MTNSKKISPITAAAFIAAGAELSRSGLRIMRVTKSGQLVAGPDNEPVTETRYLADVANAQLGYLRFVNGKVEEAMAPVSLGQKISRDDLPEHGPHDNGDGWHPAVAIQLRSMSTGEVFIFKNTSQGGRAAAGELLSKFGYHAASGGRGIPVVELTVTSYAHKRFGRVYKPSFVIVGWLDEGDPSAAPAIPDGGPPRVDAVKPNDELHDEDIPF